MYLWRWKGWARKERKYKILKRWNLIISMCCFNLHLQKVPGPWFKIKSIVVDCGAGLQ